MRATSRTIPKAAPGARPAAARRGLEHPWAGHLRRPSDRGLRCCQSRRFLFETYPNPRQSETTTQDLSTFSVPFARVVRLVASRPPPWSAAGKTDEPMPCGPWPVSSVFQYFPPDLEVTRYREPRRALCVANPRLSPTHTVQINWTKSTVRPFVRSRIHTSWPERVGSSRREKRFPIESRNFKTAGDRTQTSPTVQKRHRSVVSQTLRDLA